MKVPKINILGIGPGDKRFILPYIYDYVTNSQIIIGSKRSLDHFKFNDQRIFLLDKNINKLIDYIKENRNENITVLASGDPLFFGIAETFLNFFKLDELNIEPGISSVQYLFSKLGKSFKNYALHSIHGKKANLKELILHHKKCVFLTDRKNNYQVIAEEAHKIRRKKFIMTLGCNLSYTDEKIIIQSPSYFMSCQFDCPLAVVVIEERRANEFQNS